MSDVADWWKTSIIDMEPGRIEIRGQPIEDLIGTLSFPEMIWLMLRGSLPGEGECRLFEAALVAAVDHGPQAPSIAAAAHGRELRSAAEQRHGLGCEHAGRRSRRRGRAMCGTALPGQCHKVFHTCLRFWRIGDRRMARLFRALAIAFTSRSTRAHPVLWH